MSTEFVSISVGPTGEQTVLLAGEWTGSNLRVRRGRAFETGENDGKDRITQSRFVKKFLKDEMDDLIKKSDAVYLVLDATRS